MRSCISLTSSLAAVVMIGRQRRATNGRRWRIKSTKVGTKLESLDCPGAIEVRV